MTSEAVAAPRPRPPRWPGVFDSAGPVLTIVAALVVIWYVAAVFMNATMVRDTFERQGTAYELSDVIAGTMNQERPVLPAPHQIVDRLHGFGLQLRSPIRRAAWFITAR